MIFVAATFFPLASLFVDILIIIMFFSKKSVKNKETTLFSYLIIANFIECLFDVIGIGYVRNGGDLEIFSFLQKIDMVMIISWAALMFNYVYSVSFNEKRHAALNNTCIAVLILSSLFTLLLPNTPIIHENTLDSSGLSPDVAYVTIILFA